MSTRCNIHFHGWDRTLSNIYRHSDGYPEGRYIVWQALELAVDYDFSGEKMKKTPKACKFDFLGVSPCLEDHGDIEYTYKVDCDNRDERGFPTVTVE